VVRSTTGAAMASGIEGTREVSYSLFISYSLLEAKEDGALVTGGRPSD